MFCPNCGAESTRSLNYCKRCGAGLNPLTKSAEPQINFSKLTGMFWAIAVFGLGSLGLLIGGLLGAMGMGARGREVPTIAFFGFVMIFSICALLVRQLSRVISLTQKAQPAANFNRSEQAENYDHPQMPAPPIAVPSVTEHTTRFFERQQRREPQTRE